MARTDRQFESEPDPENAKVLQKRQLVAHVVRRTG